MSEKEWLEVLAGMDNPAMSAHGERLVAALTESRREVERLDTNYASCARDGMRAEAENATLRRQVERVHKDLSMACDEIERLRCQVEDLKAGAVAVQVDDKTLHLTTVDADKLAALNRQVEEQAGKLAEAYECEFDNTCEGETGKHEGPMTCRACAIRHLHDYAAAKSRAEQAEKERDEWRAKAQARNP